MPEKVAENLSDRKKLRGKKLNPKIFSSKETQLYAHTGGDEQRILKTIVVILVGFLLSYLRRCKFEFRAG